MRYALQNVVFRPSEIMNFIKKSNFHPNVIHVFNLQTDINVLISKSVKNAAFVYIMIMLRMSALILYCASSTCMDTRNILSKMSCFVCPKWLISSKIVNFVFTSKMLNFAISFTFCPKPIFHVTWSKRGSHVTTFINVFFAIFHAFLTF